MALGTLVAVPVREARGRDRSNQGRSYSNNFATRVNPFTLVIRPSTRGHSRRVVLLRCHAWRADLRCSRRGGRRTVQSDCSATLVTGGSRAHKPRPGSPCRATDPTSLSVHGARASYAPTSDWLVRFWGHLADVGSPCDGARRLASAGAAPTSVGRADGVVGKIHMTVSLGPQADAARRGLRQPVFKIELAVEIALDLGAGDPDFEFVPLPGRGRRIAYPFDRGAFALFELPQHQVVFEAVGTDGQVVAIWLEIEQDSSALIDTPRQPLKAYRDLAACEIYDVGHDRVWKVSVGLYAIKKLRVAFAIERARLIRDAPR